MGYHLRLAGVRQQDQSFPPGKLRGISEQKCRAKTFGGGYILFLDGDDWLEQDAVAYLVKMIGGREDVIAVCGHYNVRSEKGILRRHHQKAQQAPGFVPAEQVLQSLLEGSYSLTSACYKLYPVHIIRELRFDPDIYNMEDGLFCFQAVGQSEGIIYSTEPK